MVPLEKILIDAKDKKPPFVYYYLRVIQEDGHMAWSSPIWVDFVQPPAGAKQTSKKVQKPSPSPVHLEEEEDEDDEDDYNYDLDDIDDDE
jgi:hypothetical protein